MAIEVEDGSGKSDAESYISVDFLKEFVQDWGLGDLDAAPDAPIEAALRRATLLFDTVYGPRFLGTPVSSGQALLFPMTGLVDRRNYELPPFPEEVKNATAALASYEYNSPGSLFPNITPGKTKKQITADKVSVTYDVTVGGVGYIAGARPIISIVEGILSKIAVIPQEGSRTFYGSAVRG